LKQVQKRLSANLGEAATTLASAKHSVYHIFGTTSSLIYFDNKHLMRAQSHLMNGIIVSGYVHSSCGPFMETNACALTDICGDVDTSGGKSAVRFWRQTLKPANFLFRC
jgi:hypothetical protein